jgi:hypothetical protein
MVGVRGSVCVCLSLSLCVCVCAQMCRAADAFFPRLSVPPAVGRDGAGLGWAGQAGYWA